MIIRCKHGAQDLETIMKKKTAKVLTMMMMWLEILKIALFLFGNLYMISNIMNKKLPEECTLAYTLMKYQFLMFIFFIPDFIALRGTGMKED